jgi:hypothetical protein
MIDSLKKPEPYERQYQWAGWLALTAAVLVLPLFVLGFLVQPQWPKLAFPLLFAYVPVVVLQTAFAVFALFWFRRLLNNRFHFHDTDGLIVTIIIGAIILGAIGLAAKIGVLFVPKSALVAAGLLALVPVIMVGLPLAILSIIFAVRLLRLQDDLCGLLKPFAYTTIAAGACFLTIILAPLGFLVDAVSNALLGMIFLRILKAPAQVEFV